MSGWSKGRGYTGVMKRPPPKLLCGRRPEGAQRKDASEVGASPAAVQTSTGTKNRIDLLVPWVDSSDESAAFAIL